MSDWTLSVLWYGSFLALLLGLIVMLKPPRRAGLTSRWRGVAMTFVAALAIVVNARLTPDAHRAAASNTKLDVVLPVYHFREVHTRLVAASPGQTLAAAKNVTGDEIRLLALFTAIRRFGRPGPESILNAPGRQPILDVATRTGFIRLAEADNEVVIGTLVAAPRGFRRDASADSQWFQTLSQPGIAKAAMNFLVEDAGAGRTRITTETRVYGTDEHVLRRFTPYWRTIFPGSWILRVTWLRAIEERAAS
jgi:hypothetical protein